MSDKPITIIVITCIGLYFPIGNKNFIRKAQSGLCSTLLTVFVIYHVCGVDFGWDWGPAFLPVGIWRDIRYKHQISFKLIVSLHTILALYYLKWLWHLSLMLFHKYICTTRTILLYLR